MSGRLICRPFVEPSSGLTLKLTRSGFGTSFRAPPKTLRPKTLRDLAILAVLYGAGLRRSELAALAIEDVREDTLAVCGKGRQYRLVYLPEQALELLSRWMEEKQAVFPNRRTQLARSRSSKPRLLRGSALVWLSRPQSDFAISGKSVMQEVAGSSPVVPARIQESCARGACTPYRVRGLMSVSTKMHPLRAPPRS